MPGPYDTADHHIFGYGQSSFDGWACRKTGCNWEGDRALTHEGAERKHDEDLGIPDPWGGAVGAARPAKILREWASALRGDWGMIDGRSCQRELEVIVGWIESPATMPKTPAEARDLVDICPVGQGHWPWYCADYHREDGTEL